MQSSETIRLCLTGEYSLAVSSRLAVRSSFIEESQIGQNPQIPTVDVAFPVEGKWGTVGVRVTQSDGQIHAQLFANADGISSEDVRTQLERMLCLDTDASGLTDLIASDRVLADLNERRPGLRPVLFPSPYEAAARAIIGHRLFVRQAASVSSRICKENGVAVTVGDRLMNSFPNPKQLATLPPVEGLSELKLKQLRGLGYFAAEGKLSSRSLKAMPFSEALSYVQQLAGIGPFSAELIMLRGVGDADAFPLEEKRLHRAMAAAYHLGIDPDLAALQRVADRWRPFRSWIGLLLRNSEFGS